jgi:hypothetical protein
MAGRGSARLGLPLLAGEVVGSMIGGSVFNLPQNMAWGAALGAIAIARTLTLVWADSKGILLILWRLFAFTWGTPESLFEGR